MSVITSLTAQNTTGVSGVFDVSPDFVERQFDAVATDLMPHAVKTGMLSNAALVEVVAGKVRQYGLVNLVVDPVMVSKSGSSLLAQDALNSLRHSLAPLAMLLTPNLEEAGALTGRTIRTLGDMEQAARGIHAMGVRNVLIKGGHLEGDAIDVFFDGVEFHHLRAARIATRDSHGTGCVLSAAITAHLAGGRTLAESVRFGKEFVTDAIRNGIRIGSGTGPCDPVGL
jgi:hydroxymethylpyrimidine/phosphomethylpyrimidine kinase